MEEYQNGFYDHINGFTPNDEDILPIFDQNQTFTNGYKFKDEPLDLSFLDSPYTPQNPNPGSSQEDSPDEFNDCVFNFIDQILVEENAEGIQSSFYDPLELQATERSLYEALGQEYPYPSNQQSENSEENVFTSSGEFGPFWSFGSSSNDEMIKTHIVQNIYTDSESIKQFNLGMEEASKFLPSSKPLVIDLDQYDLPNDSRNDYAEVVVKIEKDKPSNWLKGRKHYQLEDNGYEEERSRKQSAVYVEEDSLSEMFDRVLLDHDANGISISCHKEKKLQKNGLTGGTDNIQNGKKTSETVDLSTLLVNCAQSVAAGDRRTANDQLNQIRENASISGNPIQRLAHVFATGISARLAGTGSHLYAAKCAPQISSYEKLQAYQVYLSACPFKKIAMSFANKTISDSASNSSTIHIVDFGIAYGFQWPIFIKHLSEKPNGPPKLRVTGIEYPQPGFRPSERLDETGRRLGNYCARFKVPFEYNSIASQNWETVKIEDLKLARNEFLAVTSSNRFHTLFDETVCADNPRDKVLKLIRDMKPDIFVHTIINGVYSAPFFVTRFREALFHYSSLFDMFDATLERENEQRLNFEKEFYGREAMNVIACEGGQRVERPESYKQWQVRISRAGFKVKSLNREVVSKLRCKSLCYHKDFVFDEDGKWIFQGWKGRILYATACWVPA